MPFTCYVAGGMTLLSQASGSRTSAAQAFMPLRAHESGGMHVGCTGTTSSFHVWLLFRVYHDRARIAHVQPAPHPDLLHHLCLSLRVAGQLVDGKGDGGGGGVVAGKQERLHLRGRQEHVSCRD